MPAMNLCAACHPFQSPRRNELQRLFVRVRKYLAKWHRRALSRHELMTLPDRELWDIGLTRIDAESEAGKPFWAPVISNGLLPGNGSHLLRTPLDTR